MPDGPSDRRLVPLIRWTLLEHTKQVIQVGVADVSLIHRNGRRLDQKLPAALDLYPSDLFVIHRDAERQGAAERENEIQTAITGLPMPVAVAMIPVRMQEAWLLIDEAALRTAAGNPRGRVRLDAFPKVGQLEDIPDPKDLLTRLLLTASETSGRRRDRFNVGAAVDRLSELINDYSALRALPSFVRFEAAIQNAVAANGW